MIWKDRKDDDVAKMTDVTTHIIASHWKSDLHDLPWKQTISLVNAPAEVSVMLLTDNGQMSVTKLMQHEHHNGKLMIKPKFTQLDNILGLVKVELGDVTAGCLKIIVRTN